MKKSELYSKVEKNCPKKARHLGAHMVKQITYSIHSMDLGRAVKRSLCQEACSPGTNLQGSGCFIRFEFLNLESSG